MSPERGSHVVEVPVDGGEEVVRVQVSALDEGSVRVGRGGRAVVRAEETLGRMLGVVRPVADSFVGGCREMEHPPDEVTLEFGVSLSADAKILIADSSASANFAITMAWNGTGGGERTGADGEPAAGGGEPTGESAGEPAGRPTQ